MTSDISKMFREVVFDEVDRDLHCFLQIDLTTNQLKDYRMTRVTFGMVCSPFLATQVLRQVARDHQLEFARAASTFNSTFYIDNCLTAAEIVKEAAHIRAELNV